ncbi:MAG: DUF1211 domain-containing protein [Sphingobacteriales bacterium]|nr:DUF1211 domain-containing protein [Sphingobacteriales bacterium]
MPNVPTNLLPGASKRMEALSDGVFSIAATLLVLEIKVPHFEHSYTKAEMWVALKTVLPSFIAFVFSFLNILIFWVNHDAVGKVISRYDHKTTYLNVVFLLLISLIPFTTNFVSEYPDSFVAISIYGIVLLLNAIIACVMYWYLAFGSKLMLPAVSIQSRKKIWKRIIMGPVLLYLRKPPPKAVVMYFRLCRMCKFVE